MNYDFTELEKAVRSWRRNTPKVKLSRSKLSTGWMLAIYADIDENDTDLDYRDLEKYLKWAASQLKDWPDVYKTGYNTWIFTHKKDIDKFATLFFIYQSN